MTVKPIDGTAVILHLIEAARQRVSQDFGLPACAALNEWTFRLESYLAEQIPDEQEAGWEARTWGELLPGDRVSLQGVEALVKQVALLPWHVEPSTSKKDIDRAFPARQVWHPGYDAVDEEGGAPEHCRACRGRCQRGRGFQMFPLEHSQVRVTLEFGGQENSYPMAADGEIEVLRGPAGIEIDRAAGRGAGQVQADREMVLGSWAAEAFQTLAAAGLSPEPQIMTMGESS